MLEPGLLAPSPPRLRDVSGNMLCVQPCFEEYEARPAASKGMPSAFSDTAMHVHIGYTVAQSAQVMKACVFAVHIKGLACRERD